MFRSTLKDRLRIALRGGERAGLSYLLERAANPLSPAERVEWLEQLVLWIRVGAVEQSLPEARIRFLLQRLEQNPAWRDAFARQCRELLRQASAVSLLTETGIPNASIFFREALQRFIRGIFSPEDNAQSLASVLGRVFWHSSDAEWLEALPVDLRRSLFAIRRHGLDAKEKGPPRVFEDAIAACVILTVRSAEIALREDISQRAMEPKPLENPFLQLVRLVNEWSTHSASFAPTQDDFRTLLLSCRGFLEKVRLHLEQFGVSVDLVFQLERAKAYLDRLEEIASLLSMDSAEEDLRHWDFFVSLVRGHHEGRAATRFIRDNLHLISRKTVERIGDVGEDYITRDLKGYKTMFYCAAGGGILTAGTALAKYLTPKGMPLFFEGFFAALNYSASFVIMHFLHFKLATKQPSMTAAALARKLTAKDETDWEDGFIDEVASISRSQFAAVLGNVLAAIPMALLIQAVGRRFFAYSVLSAPQAQKMLQSIDPIASWTIFCAALTGVLLWLSGFVAGWIENAYVYYRVPRALESQRFLRLLLGKSRLDKWIGWVGHNLIGVISAVTLGVLLAFVPIAGTFFGLPLDVRHITLTTASSTFALTSLNASQVDRGLIITTVAGIFSIGLMNFGVSFVLALEVAIRASGAGNLKRAELIRKVFRGFLRSPARFFFPPRRDKALFGVSSNVEK